MIVRVRFDPILRLAMPYDYILAFGTQTAAQADPVIGAYWTAPTAQSPGAPYVYGAL